MPAHLGANAIITCNGKLLLEKRKDSDVWGLIGGGVKKSETELQAIVRELYEETGIRAEAEEFELLDTGTDKTFHYDYYCIRRKVPLSQITLLPGETDDVQWASFSEVHKLIEERKMCKVIARQFKRQEPMLLSRQNAQK